MVLSHSSRGTEVAEIEGLWLPKNEPKEESEVEPNELATKDKDPRAHAGFLVYPPSNM